MLGQAESVLLCLIVASAVNISLQQTDENERVRNYFDGPDGYNKRAEMLSNQYNTISWAYYTNITSYNQQKSTEMSLLWSEFAKNESKKAKEFNLDAITNASLRRQLDAVLNVGISGYEDTKVLKQIADIEANMTGIYSSAKWCKTKTDCLSLEPELTDLLTTSRDYEELAEAWKGWRDVSGAKMRTQYEKYVELVNLAIKAQGKYEDMGDYYRSSYEDPNFEPGVRNLFDELSPLYDNLHAYVRKKLRKHYGEDKFPTEGHIPAHLFGNMWAQTWTNIYDLLEPYPGHGSESITVAMVDQNYNITRMYRLAEDFFKSLGMKPMPDSFWELSMLEKPSDGRDVVCHASAWDFTNGTDFRIKQCTTVTKDQLITVHHEMGHVQYYLEYINQPYLFRGGANPGFHEGVADIVSLSFQTPEHLQKIGLLDNLPTGTEGDINFLLKMALNKVAFLPFGYLMDQWRWSVYRGETTPDDYNKAWWDLRCKYQGISPPAQRSENDFDPGAKYHIPGNTPYIRYFVSYVLQFQWHQALCELAGHSGSLHRCDIYESKAAGKRLREMLQMGSSEQWGEALYTLTRGTSAESKKMSAKPLLDYFKPLQEWLVKQNEGEIIGWNKTSCPVESVSGSGALQSSSVLLFITLFISIVPALRNLFSR